MLTLLALLSLLPLSTADPQSPIGGATLPFSLPLEMLARPLK